MFVIGSNDIAEITVQAVIYCIRGNLHCAGWKFCIKKYAYNNNFEMTHSDFCCYCHIRWFVDML